MIECEFWRGRRVFLTGHTGFKGSWLSLWLQSMGARVTGYALAPEPLSLFEVAQVANGMTSIIGDIRDVSALQRAMRRADPEVLIHMAAQSLVRRSYIDPVETFSANVMGLVNILEAVREPHSGLKAVLNVTSDKCYQNREWIWGYRENEPLGGYDPYSSSKACAELVTESYRNSFFNPTEYSQHGIAVATARAGNVIGGGDRAADRLVPDMIRAIEQGHAVRIRSPQAIRPWQHVLEPLSGYLVLAQRLFEMGPRFGEAWNFGPAATDVRTVQWIAERLAELWGDGARWQLDMDSQPHEASYLSLDCSKAAVELDWHPKWSLEIALDRIVNWHKAQMAGEDMRGRTLDQIDQYHDLWREQ